MDADSLSGKSIDKSDTDYIKNILNDDLKLTYALTNCLNSEIVNVVEESVATRMANEGKMLPGWEYSDEYETKGMGWTKKARRPSDNYNKYTEAGSGYYSGDFAMLVHEILVSRCHYQILMSIEPIKMKLHQVVCQELSYCKNKNKDEEVGLAIGVCEALLALKLNTGFPVVAVAVYLLKKGVHDGLCQCKSN